MNGEKPPRKVPPPKPSENEIPISKALNILKYIAGLLRGHPIALVIVALMVTDITLILLKIATSQLFIVNCTILIMFAVWVISDPKSRIIVKKSLFKPHIWMFLLFLIVLPGIFVPSFLRTREVSRARNAQEELESLSGSIESYILENSAYKSGTINNIPPLNLSMLTTPVSYIKKTPYDFYSSEKESYGYLSGTLPTTNTLHQYYWVLWSVGNDHIRNFPELETLLKKGPLTSDSFVAYQYDPTNGLQSAGDIIIFDIEKSENK